MNDLISRQILTSFTGTSLALVSAFVIWLIKTSYEKHKDEIFAIRRIERNYALNLTHLNDNIEFLGKWIKSLEKNRPFSFYFGKYLFNKEDSYKIKNLILVNKIMSLDYKLERVEFDLNNIYKSYWEILSKIDEIKDLSIKKAEMEIYNSNILETLKQEKDNIEPILEELIDIIATTRIVFHTRKHSLFGYIDFLFKDIFPLLSDGKIKKEVEKIKEQIKSRKKDNSDDKK